MALGVDAGRLDAALAEAVETGAVPGAVAVVAGPEGIVHLRAYGRRDAGRPQPLADDAMFRIASMTKLPTTVAALALVQAGRLELDAPLGDYLPEFDRLGVLDGFAADGAPVIRPPRSRATVRQLCAHISGLGYDTWHAELLRYHRQTGLPPISAGLRTTFGAPLVDDPGTAINYGTSTDWLGLLVEERTGRPLAEHLAEDLFGPLGMDDTTMIMSAGQRRRAAPVHVRDGDGAWTASTLELAADPEFHAGGHGLCSTAPDFARLQLALLRGGELDGVRILEQRLVREMFTPQTGALTVTRIPTALPAASADVDLGAPHRWGLAFPLTQERRPGMRPVGSGGWAGLWNTYFWIDPVNNLVAGFYSQTSPFCEPAVIGAYERFERAVYAGVDAQ